MADDTNDHGARVTLALVAPIKQGKKAANKRIDNEPKSITSYPGIATAIEAVDRVSREMTDLDDFGRGLLKTAALQFSVLDPINDAVWNDHFRDDMRKRYQEPAKLSRIKTAIIAFSNCHDTNDALALIDGHTSLQGFCTAVRPSLIKAGLVKASKAGAPVKPGSNEPDSESGESDDKVVQFVSAQEIVNAKSMSRKEAAAILANPSGIPWKNTARLAALLVAATSTEGRATEAMLALSELFPDDDTGE